MTYCPHIWTETYYGFECSLCGLFMSHDQAPWNITDDQWSDWDAGDVEPIDKEAVKRVHELFMQKLAREYPDHPWLSKERSMQWQQPRPVDIWLWMEIELWQNGTLIKVGRVSWGKDGGYYHVSITYEQEHGLGLYCWPSFRALSDAQEFVEKLMGITSAEAIAIHGTQWPNVVL